jgi:hypothetical protein
MKKVRIVMKLKLDRTYLITLAIMGLVNYEDYLLSVYICTHYGCLELNNWIFQYPLVKILLPVIWSVVVYIITSSRDTLIQLAIDLNLLFTALFLLAVMNNTFLLLHVNG